MVDIDKLTPEQLRELGYEAWNHEGTDDMCYVQCPGGFIETLYASRARNEAVRWQYARAHLKDMIAAIDKLKEME